MSKRLGERLVEAGRLQAMDLERALRAQPESGALLGVLLVRLGMISEKDLAPVLAEHLGVPLVAEGAYPDLPVLGEEIPIAFLRRSQAVPVEDLGGCLAVAMAVPQDTYVREALALATGREIEPRLGHAADIERALERFARGGSGEAGDGVDEVTEGAPGGGAEDIERLKDMASEAPVIRLVNRLITQAIEARASDIHLEPFVGELKVRYRIDGVLHEMDGPAASLTAAVISRIKIMSRLNIAERRLPQDGRIQLRVQGKEIDLRVSTVPTMHGESVVMRVLDKGAVELSLEALQLADDILQGFQDLLARPNGILLVTGPTGSGKTTTLYAGLTRLNQPENKILTVEDPVEYQLSGVNQIQVKSDIGLTFAGALRAIVRQDPDIIMIGEMRDLETAEIAIQSALTGHLVLSTLHTNDAASGVTRLLDMGVEDYLITSTVNGILAQRLVRRLCEACREPYAVMDEAVVEMGLQEALAGGPARLWRARGCDACAGTGYRGRIGIHELLLMNDELRRLVLKRSDSGVIQQAAIQAGMREMYQDGLRKAVAGLTTVEEVLRVTRAH